jgi:hypothetical protein
LRPACGPHWRGYWNLSRDAARQVDSSIGGAMPDKKEFDIDFTDDGFIVSGLKDGEEMLFIYHALVDNLDRLSDFEYIINLNRNLKGN